MKQVYLVAEDKSLGEVLRTTYNEVLAALRHRQPNAAELIEDEEFSQLHDLLGLLRLGHLRISRVMGEKEGSFLVLEVSDSNQKIFGMTTERLR